MRLRLTLAAVLAALLALSTVAAAAQPEKPEKGPAGAKFYEPPKKLPKGHGKLIWQRRAKGLAPIDGASSNRLLLYTSKTVSGKATAVSGSVSVPPGKPPKKGWPVISWGHGTTGAADPCAPTRASASAPVAPYITYIEPILEDFLDAGYAVVRSDYQGLGTPGRHPYLVSTAEGRSVVDIVAAARRLEPDLGKRYVLAGHSQGGHAVLGGAGLAENWAPKLRLRGTVAYAPGSHMKEQAQSLPALTSPSPLSALAALILEGAVAGDADLSPDLLLQPAPLALFPQADQICLPELGASGSFGGIAPSELLRDDADTAELLDFLGKQNPAVRTSAPILMLQGTADTTVFPIFTDLLDDELVALGNRVTYTKYPGVGHGEIPFSAEDEAMAFIERRLPAR